MEFSVEEYLKIIESLLNGNTNQEAFEAGLIFARIFWGIISVVVITIIVFSMWKIFKKAGIKPWKSLIPVYNYILLYKISGVSPYLILLVLIQFIPVSFIKIVGFIIWNIVDATQKSLLVKKFGKGIGFIVGIIILDFVFYPILALDKSEYNKKINNKA